MSPHLSRARDSQPARPSSPFRSAVNLELVYIDEGDPWFETNEEPTIRSDSLVLSEDHELRSRDDGGETRRDEKKEKIAQTVLVVTRSAGVPPSRRSQPRPSLLVPRALLSPSDQQPERLLDASPFHLLPSPPRASPFYHLTQGFLVTL